MKHSIKNIWAKLAMTYTILVCTFTVCIIAVFAIPTNSLRNNIKQSAEQIEKEGLWFQPMGFYLFQIDNMTDCLMMNINVCADSDNPVEAAMNAEHAQPYKNGDTRAYKNIANTTLNVATHGRDKDTQISRYARYWHGYQVVVRPLLCFFNYNQIRVLNYIVMLVLLSVTGFLLYKMLNLGYALTFLASLVITNAMIVPLAIQFSTCFHIAMIGMIIILARRKLADDRDKAIILFFSIGAFTSYMDFLTTPIITLGFPLVVLMALRKNNGKIKAVITQSVAWGAGYTSIWVSKWIIGSILTGENIFESALGCAQQRVGDTIVFGGKEMPMSNFFDIIFTKVSSIISPVLLGGIILIIVALAAFYFYKNRRQLKKEGWIMLIAAMPVVWFIVLKNHSLQHIFFTWRDFILTLWCLLIFVYHVNYKQYNHENSRSNTML